MFEPNSLAPLFVVPADFDACHFFTCATNADPQSGQICSNKVAPTPRSMDGRQCSCNAGYEYTEQDGCQGELRQLQEHCIRLGQGSVMGCQDGTGPVMARCAVVFDKEPPSFGISHWL
jgi:hypothetical protein